MQKKDKILVVTTLIKYMFAVGLTLFAFSESDSDYYIVAGLLELLLIFFFSNICMEKKRLGIMLNGILMLLYNVQMTVFLFGNTYISMVMLTNLASIKALSGSAALYITGAVLAIVFSFLPICKFEFGKRETGILFSGTLLLGIIFTILAGAMYSPFYGYVNLMIQHYENKQSEKMIEALVEETVSNMDHTGNADSDGKVVIKNEFYHNGIEDHIKKEETLAEQPNVILIFTEGLSQNIVSDERNIMPNAAAFQKEALSFINYYNHTFATYRGLNGQLYSSHQLGDMEANPLISIQSILSDQGYKTFFINTEPHNQDFTKYLEDMQYDAVIGDTTYECNGIANTISDKDAYEILYENAAEMAKDDEPFFISIYTFGTHASFDSVNEKFEDGQNPLLNKFYDADYQFGNFMKKVKENADLDNTMIIFTADHCTYEDDPFDSAFPDYKRESLYFDEIPLSIYYKGITADVIDAGGRTSLDLAPTILDYLDISAPNYFLGTSLFADKASSMLETSFYDSCSFYSSSEDRIEILNGTALDELRTTIEQYYVTKAVVANH